MGILHQPNSINAKIKRVSRLVILPDYQGIGLGTRFLDYMAKIYVDKGYDFSIITSAKNLGMSLAKNNKWCCSRYDIKRQTTSATSKIDRFRKVRQVKTFTFFYKKGR